MALKRGIDKAVAAVVEELKKISRPDARARRKSRRSARISANNDKEIGDLIAEAMEKVGKDGVITVEEAKGLETTLETVDGMQFDRGYLSPYFVTDPEKMEAVLEDALILIHDKKISSMKDLLPVLEKVAQMGKPLLIIAEDIEGEALATLVVNKLRGTLHVAAVKAPGFGDRRKAMLQDIAVLTGRPGHLRGSRLQARERRRHRPRPREAHRRRQGQHDDHRWRRRRRRRSRAASRRSASAIDKSTSDYDKEKLQERLAKLAGGVAVINVGAATESRDEGEEGPRRGRAARHARGGRRGHRPRRRRRAHSRAEGAQGPQARGADEQIGVDIIRRAIEEPIRMIVQNAGGEGSIVVEKVRSVEGQRTSATTP